MRRAKPATWCEHDEYPKEVLVVGVDAGGCVAWGAGEPGRYAEAS
jgi:hypothetical protein